MAPKITRHDPPYIQVVNFIREKIHGGELKAGDRIPSVRQIMADYEVSNATAVKALTALKAEGLTEVQEGIGTIVKSSQVLVSGPDRLQMLRVTGSGFRSNERAEILFAKLIAAPSDVADALGVDEGASVVLRRRAYYDDNGIVALSSSWLSGQIAEAAPELLSPEPLPQMTFGLVEERTGRRAVRRRDVVAIKQAPEDLAGILGTEAGTAILTMTNSYWDQEGNVTEYAEDYLGVGRKLSAEYSLD